jgi:hypothetical protein
MTIRNEKRAKQKITCKRNHFRKLGPPLTPCRRMESNCFNVGCPLHFQYVLSNISKIWLDFLHVRVYVKHGIVPFVVHDIMCTRSPQHLYPSIGKLTARSTELFLLCSTVSYEHSHCWRVRNTCLRSL